VKLTMRFQFVAICIVSFALLSLSSAQQGQSSKVVSIPYAKVAPLIKTQCLPCHNATRHPEAIDLSSLKALMKSGEHGPIVIPGHPEKSKLILYVDGEKQPRMPFKKAPLGSKDIQLLRNWISAGAKS